MTVTVAQGWAKARSAVPTDVVSDLIVARCRVARSARWTAPIPPTYVHPMKVAPSGTKLMWRWSGLAAVAVLSAALVTCAFWPSLEGKLRRDLELMMSGRAANETEVIGGSEWICFDGGRAYDEFLSESKRLGDPFTRSLRQCGVESSCCNLASDTGGVIGLVKGGGIRCVEIDAFDVYLKADGSFCGKPERLAVSRKIVGSGERPLGRPWVARSGRTSFDVGEKSP